MPQYYPRHLVTIGDHLRKRRLEFGLSQPQLAKQLGVSAASILNWELRKQVPELRFLKRLWEFVGMRIPIDAALPPQQAAADGAIGERIRCARRRLALTQVQLARHLGVDPCTVQSWETGRHGPQACRREKLWRWLREAGQ
jgi:DNA-binding transcriptional regulator YiaG